MGAAAGTIRSRGTYGIKVRNMYISDVVYVRNCIGIRWVGVRGLEVLNNIIRQALYRYCTILIKIMRYWLNSSAPIGLIMYHSPRCQHKFH